MGLRFDKLVLIEIIDIVRQGLLEQKDVSALLKGMDMVAVEDAGEITLSPEYLARTKRG